MGARHGLFVLLVSSALAVGCKDVSRFSTEPGESYCGQIVSAPFVRRGFADGLRMRMTFDADHIADAPGTLSTDDRLLTDAPLRPVPELFNDPLSTFTFGEGRDRNLLFAIDPTDATRGPTIMAFVSLMHAGDAEIRLMRGAPSADGGVQEASDGEPLFGVFAPMAKESGRCSF